MLSTILISEPMKSLTTFQLKILSQFLLRSSSIYLMTSFTLPFAVDTVLKASSIKVVFINISLIGILNLSLSTLAVPPLSFNF